MKTLFVSLDTVSANRLACLGCSRIPTPNIDELARSSALFTNAFASDIPTQPSHTSVFTGRYGISTGIVSHFHPPATLSEDTAWLPSLFQRLGHRTAAVDHLFAMKKWFIRGYEDYMVPPGRSRSPASVVNALSFPWLVEHRDEDFFLFLHYWDAHIPYVPPEPFKSTYSDYFATPRDPLIEEKLRNRPSYPLFKRNLYDYLDRIPNLEYIEALHYAEVAYLDSELGRLLNHLESLHLLDEMMIVVFGDHGEVMTEHDAWFDHAGLYDSVVHVPLLIRAPGLVPPARVDGMLSLVDVMPTVLQLQHITGFCGPDEIDGQSLVPLIEGSDKARREAVMLSECTWQAKRGVRTARWKYIRCWNPGIYPRSEPELYDLQADPMEQVNVAGDHPGTVGELDRLLQDWIRDSLNGRPDPMVEVVDYGLPAVARLSRVMSEELELAAPQIIDIRANGQREGTMPGRSSSGAQY